MTDMLRVTNGKPEMLPGVSADVNGNSLPEFELPWNCLVMDDDPSLFTNSLSTKLSARGGAYVNAANSGSTARCADKFCAVNPSQGIWEVSPLVRRVVAHGLISDSGTAHPPPHQWQLGMVVGLLWDQLNWFCICHR